jgi:hypothetical protein
VLVLSNVARLTPQQQEGVAQFLGTGGGVLVTLGSRVEAQQYNEQLFRAGEGWLPARLDDMAGDEADLAHAPAPLPSSFFHPALDLFREVTTGGLGDARFPRWWKVTVPGRNSPSVPVALLSNNAPLLVERPYPGSLTHTDPGVGRVLLCTVPLDNSWRTNLPDLPAFAPLAHELVYYLAGARPAEHNVQPGQPLHYRHEGTRETGVYQLRTEDKRTLYYVVQPDPRESDLTPCDGADREKVAKLVPMTYENDRPKMTAVLTASSERQELWWWFLIGMIALLCGEVWMTRRIVRNR